MPRYFGWFAALGLVDEGIWVVVTGRASTRLGVAMSVVVLSTADWNATLWTNKQHVARSLRDAGLNVLYVESLGLRRPTLSKADRTRLLRRLRSALRPPRKVEPGIWCWSPLVVPLQQFAVVRAVNRVILTVGVSVLSRLLLSGHTIVWTYNPLTCSLLSKRHQGAMVYHCVDDLAAQPGIPVGPVVEMERVLVRRARAVFVTSRELERKWSALRPVQYDPNCVDAHHFERALSVPKRDPRIVRPVRARIGFVGAVAEYKVDVALLAESARRLADCEVLIAGPREDRSAAVDAFLTLPNVTYVGTIAYPDLPEFLSSLDVGIVPTVMSEYAKSMFPMKFFEYLAAGIPVVATDLPSLAEFKHCAAVVPREEFVDALEAVLRGECPPLETRQSAYTENTYAARTDRMLQHVTAALEGR